MKTEDILSTMTIERTGTLTLTRVTDFAKLAAEATDGKVDASALLDGGDFIVQLVPTGRDPQPLEWAVDGNEAGLAFMAGFVACADARRRKSGGASSFDPAAWLAEHKRADVAALTKPQVMALAKHLDVDFQNPEKKGEIASRVEKKVRA